MTEYICLTYIPELRAVIRTEDGDKGYTMSEALSEIARLKKSATCKNCQQGNVLIKHIETVSRDMATDTGDSSLEGAAWDWGSEWVRCQCCQGDWQNCPVCGDPDLLAALRQAVAEMAHS